jgi:hypothetical protein
VNSRGNFFEELFARSFLQEADERLDVVRELDYTAARLGFGSRDKREFVQEPKL